jgi:hypothetical protein
MQFCGVICIRGGIFLFSALGESNACWESAAPLPHGGILTGVHRMTYTHSFSHPPVFSFLCETVPLTGQTLYFLQIPSSSYSHVILLRLCQFPKLLMLAVQVLLNRQRGFIPRKPLEMESSS